MIHISDKLLGLHLVSRSDIALHHANEQKSIINRNEQC